MADVLASFNAPKKNQTNDRPGNASSAPVIGASTSAAGQSTNPPLEEDFEASLAQGMEQLLRQLAGDHPPGPMAGATPDGAKGKEADPSASVGFGEPLSKEDEEEAWKRAVDMMLSGEGLDALGLDAKGQPKTSSGSGEAPKSGPSEPKPDFQETIRRTMEQLKAPKAGAGGGDGPDLAALLAQLGSDPSALEGLEGLGEGDDELGGLLDGMMAQLMTKEVLEEPMAELAAKYPAYLASPPAGTDPKNLETYRKQYVIVQQIDATFKKNGYSDEVDGKEVARLVGDMQDLGGPPKEIMGDMPEGFVSDPTRVRAALTPGSGCIG